MSNHRHIIYACVALSLLALQAFAQDAPPPAAAQPCLACHGAQGQGLAAAGHPRLAGLPAQYLADQMSAYIDGRRTNAIMAGMAKSLSAEQIQAIAHYFSALSPNIAPSPPPTDLAQAALGQQIAMHGDWAQGIPACFSCHAADGGGIPPEFPPIVGQPAAYIEAQLKAWQSGARQGRADDLANTLMQNVALRMSEAQIKAVAVWLAALPSAASNANSKDAKTKH
ncbi:MAG: c-type cytochrome [Pseudomonadota bacterium]